MSLRIVKDGKAISNVEQWHEFAPPREPDIQWVDGRSAKELAKAFLRTGSPATPAELQALLDSTETVGAIELQEAIPEHKIDLDRFPGGTRNADLAAVGQAKTDIVAVTVEAKADEEFAKTISKTLADASEHSNLPKRIEALSSALFGRSDDSLGGLRYQLLHGTAATLIFAKERAAAAAVFVIYEFKGASCTEANLTRNASDLQAFVDALPGAAGKLSPGTLIGPITVPGGEFVPGDIPLYIGKVSRSVDA